MSGNIVTGSTVGRYQIHEKLGEGGMGEVYRAVDTVLDREVAIKVLRPELAADSAVLERFQHEARTSAKLHHPNVATVYSFEEIEGRHLLVMEYVPGRTLGAMLRESGAMPLQRALGMMRQILAGVGHAHDRGIIHRDLKPANVQVMANGEVKLMDFGIARITGSSHLTQHGMLIGTIAYMSPERILGRESDHRSDIFSLGILLHQMLAGRLPFEADSDFALMRSQMEDQAPALEELGVEVPAEVQAAIYKCIEKDPEARFQSVAEFDAALAPFAPADPITGSRPAATGPRPVPVIPEPPSTPAAGDPAPLASSEAAPPLPAPQPASQETAEARPPGAPPPMPPPLPGTPAMQPPPPQGQAPPNPAAPRSSFGSPAAVAGDAAASGPSKAPLPAAIPPRKSSQAMTLVIVAVVILAIAGLGGYTVNRLMNGGDQDDSTVAQTTPGVPGDASNGQGGVDQTPDGGSPGAVPGGGDNGAVGAGGNAGNNPPVAGTPVGASNSGSAKGPVASTGGAKGKATSTGRGGAKAQPPAGPTPNRGGGKAPVNIAQGRGPAGAVNLNPPAKGPVPAPPPNAGGAADDTAPKEVQIAAAGPQVPAQPPIGTPQPPVASPKPPPVAAPPVDPASPPRGSFSWRGTLAQGQVLVISAARTAATLRVSTGAVGNGNPFATFPDWPARVRVDCPSNEIRIQRSPGRNQPLILVATRPVTTTLNCTWQATYP